MKTFVSIMLFMFTAFAQAATVLSSGDIKFTGDAYISTLSDTETKGIGRISTITQGEEILWSSGTDGNYINFVFGGYTPVVSPVAPIFNFQAADGYVDFFANAAGVFDTTLNVDAGMSAIKTGALLLSTVGVGPTVGIATSVSYSANGFLDITGGLYQLFLDTNSRPIFNPSGLADMSFGLVGSNNRSTIVNKDYAYIASADAQGSVSQVPVPAAIWMMLSGLAFMIPRKATLTA